MSEMYFDTKTGSLEQVQDRGRPINSLDDYYYARTFELLLQQLHKEVRSSLGGW